MRSLDLDDVDVVEISKALREGNTTPEEAEAIYRMTALPTVDDRYVIPPIQREEAISTTCSPEMCKGCTGLGTTVEIDRGP